MASLIIVGAQWGDEAKGKLVDVLSGEARYVVRFGGGNNAGHTVIIGGQTYKFHLLPAGILHPQTTSVLGGGMVICPQALVRELTATCEQAPAIGRLLVSPAAHVVFPYHRRFDAQDEEARGENKIGTTSRGIGPAYTDKVHRLGIRMGEFVHREVFPRRLREVLDVKNRILAGQGEEPIDFESLYEEYKLYAEKLRPFVVDTETEIAEAIERGERVLFEGAQGAFLDLDHGTYPYVTSSHPTAGGACLGTGVGPLAIQGVLGVAKAYTTRVGEGPFPTELFDSTGDQIREQGHEYGTTTGRPRRVGWLDLPLLRHSRRINSMSGLVLTRLDVLAGIPELKVATGYRFEGQVAGRMPSTLAEWRSVEPVYETLPGWFEDLRRCRTWDDLPAAVQGYVRFVEERVGAPAAILSVGPDREETITLRPDLIWG